VEALASLLTPGKISMKTLRHPPSRELWKFCMERLRDLRGPDTRERDLANLLGFEHSRAVRWKEGQMYVDRAEYLVRLADALDVETMLLVGLAGGSVNAEQAQRQLGRVTRIDEGKRRRPAPKGEAPELSTDATTFAIDPARFEAASRGVVLLIAASGEGRADLGATLSRSPHDALGGLVATSFSMGLCLAERHRPELVFIDMGLANVQAFDACRVLAGLTSRSQRRCRVVAGTTTLTDEVEKPALMAGAASVVLFPFAADLFESELDRLEERLGARKVAKR
jgi:CheY-like chemotaxis protein